MPILHSIIHRIDKGAGDRPARLDAATVELPPSDTLDTLLEAMNKA